MEQSGDRWKRRKEGQIGPHAHRVPVAHVARYDGARHHHGAALLAHELLQQALLAARLIVVVECVPHVLVDQRHFFLQYHLAKYLRWRGGRRGVSDAQADRSPARCSRSPSLVLIDMYTSKSPSASEAKAAKGRGAAGLSRPALVLSAAHTPYQIKTHIEAVHVGGSESRGHGLQRRREVPIIWPHVQRS